jgi:hypothetical protein
VELPWLLAARTPHDTLSTPILERDRSGVTTLAVAGLRPLGNGCRFAR